MKPVPVAIQFNSITTTQIEQCQFVISGTLKTKLSNLVGVLRSNSTDKVKTKCISGLFSLFSYVMVLRYDIYKN